MNATVERIDLSAPGTKTRALAWVSLQGEDVSILIGPYRIVAGPTDRPRIYPPSCRMGGGWTDAVRVDPATSRTIGDLIYEAFAKAKYPETEQAQHGADGR